MSITNKCYVKLILVLTAPIYLLFFMSSSSSYEQDLSKGYDGPLLIVLEQGRLADPTIGEMGAHWRYISEKFRKNQDLEMIIVGTSSERPFGSGQMSDINNQRLALLRGCRIVASFLKESGFVELDPSRLEEFSNYVMAQLPRIKIFPIPYQTNDGRPFILIDLLKRPAMKDFEELIEQAYRDNGSLLLENTVPIIGGRLPDLSDAELALLDEQIRLINADPAKSFRIIHADPKVRDVISQLLIDRGLEYPQEKIIAYSPGEGPASISVINKLGGWPLEYGQSENGPEDGPADSVSAPDFGEEEAESEEEKDDSVEEKEIDKPQVNGGVLGKKNEWSVITGARLNVISGFGDHLDKELDQSPLFPAFYGSVFYGPFGLGCQIQPRGSIFQNRGGDLTFADISLIYRLAENLNVFLSYKGFVAVKKKSIPTRTIISKEKLTDSYALGVEYVVQLADGKRVPLGLGLVLGLADRKYSIDGFDIENSKTEFSLSGYCSIGVDWTAIFKGK